MFDNPTFFYFFPAMCDDCIVAERDSDEPFDDQRAVRPHSRRHSFFNFFLHSVYRREGSIANTHAERVIMVWRKAAVSARKAEDHAERRRPVNQPRGLNRRESASFDSARRCGCSAGILRPTFFGFTAVTPPM